MKNTVQNMQDIYFNFYNLDMLGQIFIGTFVICAILIILINLFLDICYLYQLLKFKRNVINCGTKEQAPDLKKFKLLKEITLDYLNATKHNAKEIDYKIIIEKNFLKLNFLKISYHTMDVFIKKLNPILLLAGTIGLVYSMNRTTLFVYCSLTLITSYILVQLITGIFNYSKNKHKLEVTIEDYLVHTYRTIFTKNNTELNEMYEKTKYFFENALLEFKQISENTRQTAIYQENNDSTNKLTTTILEEILVSINSLQITQHKFIENEDELVATTKEQNIEECFELDTNMTIYKLHEIIDSLRIQQKLGENSNEIEYKSNIINNLKNIIKLLEDENK